MVKCWPLGKGSGASAVWPLWHQLLGCRDGLGAKAGMRGMGEAKEMRWWLGMGKARGKAAGVQGAPGVGRDQGREVQEAGGELREGLGEGESQRIAGGGVHRGLGEAQEGGQGALSGELLSNVLSKLELHLISHLNKRVLPRGKKRFQTI